MTRRLWLAALALAIPTGLALASDADDAGKSTPPPPTQPTTPPERETERPADKAKNPGTQKQVDKLAAEFKVAPADIEALRAKGLGWGEIRHAYAIAHKANVPVADVIKLRESGMGWGRIAHKYNTTPQGGDRGGRGDRDDRASRGGHEDHDRGHAAHGGGHGAHGGGRR